MKETPNLDYVEQLAGEDLEFKKKFIEILKDEFPNEMALYYQHIQQNEPKAASLDVHKIKHKMNIIGLDESYAIATCYEKELRDGKTDMHSHFDVILNIMKNYIKSI